MGSGSSGYKIGKGGGGSEGVLAIVQAAEAQEKPNVKETTAGSRDAGYRGGADHHHSLRENIGRLTEKYPLCEGHFGRKGTSSDRRRIASPDPLATAHDFYDRATYGGREMPLEKGNGFKTKMADGSVFTIRDVSGSKDKSPAVQITVKKSTDDCGIKAQRIHFVLE